MRVMRWELASRLLLKALIYRRTWTSVAVRFFRLPFDEHQGRRHLLQYEGVHLARIVFEAMTPAVLAVAKHCTLIEDTYSPTSH